MTQIDPSAPLEAFVAQALAHRRQYEALEEVRERTSQTLARCSALWHRKQGGSLTASEQRELDRLVAESNELERTEAVLVDRVRGGAAGPGPARRDVGVSVDRSDSTRLSARQSVVDWAASRGLSAAGVQGDSPFFIGGLIHEIVTGERRAEVPGDPSLSELSDPTGGFLVPTPLAARFIDRLRAASRVIQAGAVTVPMTSKTLAIPRLVDADTPQWKEELDTFAPSGATFDRVEFTAHTLPMRIKLSVELFEDMTDASSAGIENEIASALASELDRVALYGTGTPPEPEGVQNQTGVETPGAVADWDDVIDVVATLRTNNTEPNALLWDPTLAATFAKLKGQDQYLRPPADLDGLSRFPTTQVLTGEAFVGDFSQLMIGMRTDLRFGIRLLTAELGEDLSYTLLAYLRADVQLEHGEAFAYCATAGP